VPTFPQFGPHHVDTTKVFSLKTFVVRHNEIFHISKLSWSRRGVTPGRLGKSFKFENFRRVDVVCGLNWATVCFDGTPTCDRKAQGHTAMTCSIAR